MPFEIRTYVPADHDFVWKLHNDVLNDTGGHGGNGPWDDDLHNIEDIYLDAGGEFLVGTLDGDVVAMGAYKRTSADSAEIKRMRVHTPRQRNGLGQRILDELQHRAAAAGYTLLHLDTLATQGAAQQFYEKNGFQRVRQERIGEFDCVFYEKRIGPETETEAASLGKRLTGKHKGM